MNISIIIPTFNRAFILPRAIESILNQTHQRWELIIVDDGSTDDTSKVVNRYHDDRIRYFEVEHRGTPHAWNLGASRANYPVMFFMGDDVELDPQCLEKLARASISVGDDWGSIAPSLHYVRNFSEQRKDDVGLKYAHIDRLTGNVVGSFNVKNNTIKEVEVTHGYNLVNGEAFWAVDGFDTQTYSGNYYREETDLWLRIRSKGYKLYYQPEARIYTLKGISKGGQWSNIGGALLMYEYYVLKNHYAFLKKFYASRRFIMFLLFVLQRAHERLIQYRAKLEGPMAR